MYSGLGVQQSFVPTVQVVVSGTGKCTGKGHYGICSGWNNDWCSINDMIGMVAGYSYVGIGMVRCGGVYGWCVCIADVIGIDRLVDVCGRGGSES